MLEAQRERRRMQRCEVEEPVTISFWEHGPREITGTVYNASPDGIFFQAGKQIPQDSLVDLVFLFPATLRSPGVRFVCKCRIIRAPELLPAGGFGMAAAILRTESERLTLEPGQPEEALLHASPVLAD